MAIGVTRARGLRRSATVRRATNWARNLWIAIFVLVAGLIAGSQIARTDKRMLQVLAAGVLIVTALRLSSFSSMLFLVVAFPFRKATTYGSTMTLFTLLVFMLWLARLTLRVERPAGRSALDLPVAALVCSYLLSFSQFDTMQKVSLGAINFFMTLSSIFFAYLVIHLTRTEKELRRLVGAVVVVTMLILLTAVFELFFPTRALVPGWIDLGAIRFQETAARGLEISGMRVGGVFADYELLAEFCAMTLILLWFIYVRTRGAAARVAVLAMLLLDTFVLMATVTRGAFVSLGVAAGFLVWKMRRRIRFHTLVISLALVLGCGWLLFNFVAYHTRSGNILERMQQTEFKGLVPDDRVGVWGAAWERIIQRPLLGYGPYYGHVQGVADIYMPHSIFLVYWHMLGIVGLLVFLWILVRLWRETRHAGAYLTEPSFASGLLLALKAMFILFVVDEIKIEYIRNDKYQYWVWLFSALIVVSARIVTEQKKAAVAGVEPLPAAANGGSGLPQNAPRRRLPAVRELTAPAE